MATGKNWRSQHTVWLQVHIWTESTKVRIQHCYVMLAWWRCTITRPTPMTTWQPRLSSTQSTSTRTFECALSCSSCVSASSYIAHAPHGLSPSCVRHSSHPHALMMCAVLPRHWSLHPLPLAPPVALLPLLPPLEVRRQPAHSAQREYGLHWLDLPPHISGTRKIVRWFRPTFPPLFLAQVHAHRLLFFAEQKSSGILPWREREVTQIVMGGERGGVSHR